MSEFRDPGVTFRDAANRIHVIGEVVAGVLVISCPRCGRTHRFSPDGGCVVCPREGGASFIVERP